jgi:DNA-binding response OmpR family regulator
MRLLLIEEDPLIAMTLRLELEDAGHAVIEAPAEVRAIVESSRGADLHAVMIDIDTREPGRGLEVAGQIREHCPETPLLLLTAEVQITPRLRNSALCIIRKPFVLGEVLAAVECIAADVKGHDTPPPRDIRRPAPR